MLVASTSSSITTTTTGICAGEEDFSRWAFFVVALVLPQESDGRRCSADSSQGTDPDNCALFLLLVVVISLRRSTRMQESKRKKEIIFATIW